MITKQVRFLDTEENKVFGGILVDDGCDSFIICGCCGGIYELPDAINEGTIEDVTPLDWIDISDEIIGDLDSNDRDQSIIDEILNAPPMGFKEIQIKKPE